MTPTMEKFIEKMAAKWSLDSGARANVNTNNLRDFDYTEGFRKGLEVGRLEGKIEAFDCAYNRVKGIDPHQELDIDIYAFGIEARQELAKILGEV